MTEAICLLWFWWRALRGWPPRTRRAPRHAPHPAPYSASAAARPRDLRFPASRRAPERRRTSRTRDREVLDGDAVALVRPYVVHAEQRRRRRELELALDGYEHTEPLWIHGVRVEAVA